MTAAQLISIAIQVSMGLMIFCVGLHAEFEHLADLLKHRGLLARSLLAMNVIMPAFALALSALFDLNRPLEVALVALAVSPVPPILPTKQLSAGGTQWYVIGLLVVAGLVSIVFVPAVVEIFGLVSGRPVATPLGSVAWIVVSSLLLPLAAGLVVKWLAPGFANRAWRPLSVFAGVLLGVAFVPVLVRIWPAIAAAPGNYTLVAIVAFVVVGLAVGDLLGGPKPNDRAVLALSTATRHPGVALAIAQGSPDVLDVLAVVLLCLVVGSVLSVPYLKWRTRGGSPVAAG